MIKKAYVLFLTTMLCAHTSYTLDHKTDETKRDNRYTIGSLILANTVTVATAYVLVSLVNSPPDVKERMLSTMAGIAAITTTGCVLVEGMNSIDHLANPSNKIDPKLEAAIKKLSDQKQ